MLEAFKTYILGESAMIAAAPLSFVMISLVLAGLIWGLMKWQYGGVLSHKDAEIKLLERQVSDLRDKIITSSPESLEKRRKIRLALGQFLTEGQLLMQRCAEGENPLPKNETDAWDEQCEKYLSENLDDSFVARFRDSSDTPSTMIIGSNITREHQNLWAIVRDRTVRLQEFLKEFPPSL